MLLLFAFLEETDSISVLPLPLPPTPTQPFLLSLVYDLEEPDLGEKDAAELNGYLETGVILWDFWRGE